MRPPFLSRFRATVAGELRGCDRFGLVVLAVFVAVMIWPGIVCLATVSSEDSPMAGFPALLCGLAAATALLLLTSRLWLNLLLVLPLVLFQPVEWYAVHTYHSQVSPAMFAVFFLTNVGEASGYLADRWPVIVLGAGLWLGFVAAVGWLFWRRKVTVPLRLRLVVAVPLLLAASALAMWRSGGLDGLRIHNAAAPFTGSAIRYVQMLNQRGAVERFTAQRRGFVHGAVSTRPDEPQLVILILGESLRAGSLQINGYQRPTTPCLARREGLITLPDAVACGHLTTMALPPALTGVQADDSERMNRRSSLVAAFREAGFRTWWLSNQAPTGRWDELVASYAQEAEVVRWMNPAPLISEWGKVQYYDDAMLPALAEVLRDLPGKTLIVLHMQGSHMRYELRYPPAKAVFLPAATPGAGENYRTQPELMRNAYDNSVIATDVFVDACIAMHQSTGRPGFVMFVADHGESLFDDEQGFQGHGCLPPPPVEFRVPWLMWPSPAERERHPGPWRTVEAQRHLPVSTQDLYQTALELAGVSVREGDPQRNLASPDYRPLPRRLVDIGGRLLDFDREVEVKRP